jgi:hypothetical protein
MKYQQDMALRYDRACPNLIRSAVLPSCEKCKLQECLRDDYDEA